MYNVVKYLLFLLNHTVHVVIEYHLLTKAKLTINLQIFIKTDVDP